MDDKAILLRLHRGQRTYNALLVVDGLELFDNSCLDGVATPGTSHLLARVFEELNRALANLYGRNGDVEDALLVGRERKILR